MNIMTIIITITSDLCPSAAAANSRHGSPARPITRLTLLCSSWRLVNLIAIFITAALTGCAVRQPLLCCNVGRTRQQVPLPSQNSNPKPPTYNTLNLNNNANPQSKRVHASRVLQEGARAHQRRRLPCRLSLWQAFGTQSDARVKLTSCSSSERIDTVAARCKLQRRGSKLLVVGGAGRQIIGLFTFAFNCDENHGNDG